MDLLMLEKATVDQLPLSFSSLFLQHLELESSSVYAWGLQSLKVYVHILED